MAHALNHSTLVYLVIALVMAIAFGLGFVDHDAGGYPDGVLTRAMFYDKAVHVVCAVALTLALALLMSEVAAVGVTIAAGALLEYGQSCRKGYFSLWDLAADAGGAMLAWCYAAGVQGFA